MEKLEANKLTEKAETVEQYINFQTGEIKERLNKMRELILSCSDEITEKISWGMATFQINGKNLVHFSSEKRHMGFHPSPSPIIAFAEQLKEYKTSKGTVQFPYDKPIPYNLIKEIVVFRVNEMKENTI